METSIQQRIYEILSSVLECQVNEHTSLSMENCEQWSSLAHIDIVMSIEEEFGISFKREDLDSIIQQESLIAKVQEIISRESGL